MTKVDALNYMCCYTIIQMLENKKQNILVIDDSIEIQSLLRTLLEARGFNVHSSMNGKEAIELLNRLLIFPDLILLDEFMPKMDGPQFRNFQLSSIKLKNIPVIVMSGNDRGDMCQLMQQPCAILTKPLCMKRVLETIWGILPQNKH
jgi:CheY-like chemotaxis protein